MQNLKTLMLLYLLLSISLFHSQDEIHNPNNPHDPILFELQSHDPHFQNIPQKSFYESRNNWQAIIDSTWGPGLPTASKLAIFDATWNILNAEFPVFYGLNPNIMDSLRGLYRPEIQAGVSRGRFAAIMNYFCLAFQESHTIIFDIPVNLNTQLAPGVPLFVISPITDNSHFGASLTPLPDSTLLILKVLPNHPLGLIPGDIVLGYDGLLWKDLYPQLLAAELPLFTCYLPMTTESAITHSMLMSAGMNWHLCDTLDVLKYNTGDTLHYPTNLLVGQTGNISGNEQLQIPGVPFPDIDWQGIYAFGLYNLGDYVSWGIIDGTNIGYIYVFAWLDNNHAPGSNISLEFYNAIDSLMNYHQVEGLIIDDRLNFGGQRTVDDLGLSVLFNSYIETIGGDKRYGDPNNHFQMTYAQGSIEEHAIFGDPKTYFDRPMAVLTGPNAVSAGDIFALKMTFHPMVRIFGKSTCGAFSSMSTHYNFLGYPDWRLIHTLRNYFLVSNPGNYLARTESHVDEEVWFTPDDVANGEDTVVKAALAWINSMIYAYNMKINSAFIRPTVDTLKISTKVKNPPNHNIALAAIINTFDSVFVDSLPMYDDGNHGDSLAGDGIYGCLSNTIATEDFYTISASLTDLDSSHSQYLPNVKRFTTIGPVVFDSLIAYDGYIIGPFYRVPIKLKIRNDGANATAENIRAYLTTSNSHVVAIDNNNQNFGNIAAGQTVLSPDSFIIRFQNPDSIEYIALNIEFYSDNILWWQDSTDSTDLIVGIRQLEVAVPLSFGLRQNYPNPFNPSTTIEFDLPKTREVTLKVYNILGEEVVTLVSDRLSAGSYSYEWSRTGNLASGVYLYRLEAEGFVETRKMILMR